MRELAIPTVSLRPEPGVAAVWSAWGGLLVAAGIWFVLDTPRSILAWSTLASFTLVAAYFLLQLVVPSWFQVRLTHDELQARTFWVRQRVSWDDVHLARVRRLFGDPILELQVRETADGTVGWNLSTIGVLLPVGARLEDLHAFLAQRLGTGSLQPPDRLEPLDRT